MKRDRIDEVIDLLDGVLACGDPFPLDPEDGWECTRDELSEALVRLVRARTQIAECLSRSAIAVKEAHERTAKAQAQVNGMFTLISTWRDQAEARRTRALSKHDEQAALVADTERCAFQCILEHYQAADTERQSC